jgi:hypothetical protein
MKGVREAATVAAARTACCAVPALAATGIAVAPVGAAVAGVAAAGAGVIAVRERRRRLRDLESR